jgi:hypothetical protein
MKAIYLSIALFFLATPSIAQNMISDLTVLPGLNKNSLFTWNQQPTKKGFSPPKFGTLKLPQNNMPCFVPDLSAIAVMPVLKVVSQNQLIPNPYFNYNNQPESTVNSLTR